MHHLLENCNFIEGFSAIDHQSTLIGLIRLESEIAANGLHRVTLIDITQRQRMSLYIQNNWNC
jgi:hypothetical protein